MTQRTDFQTAHAAATAHIERAQREVWSVERNWAERISSERRAKMLESETALAVYLIDEFEYWTGKPATDEDRERIIRLAATVWASRQSAKAVA